MGHFLYKKKEICPQNYQLELETGTTGLMGQNNVREIHPRR